MEKFTVYRIFTKLKCSDIDNSSGVIWNYSNNIKLVNSLLVDSKQKCYARVAKKLTD